MDLVIYTHTHQRCVLTKLRLIDKEPPDYHTSFRHYISVKSSTADLFIALFVKTLARQRLFTVSPRRGRKE